MSALLANLYGYSGISARLAPHFGVLRPFWAHLSYRPQSISHQPHVAQCKQRDDLRCVFDKTSVTGLAIAKLTLDDSELMLNLGSDRRLQMLEPIDNFAHAFWLDRFALAALHGDVPSGFDVLGVFTLFNTSVASVTVHSFFLPR